MEWRRLEERIQTGEDDDIKSALTELQQTANISALDQEPTLALMPLCMDQLQHHDIEIRALAINIIANQMRANNWAMERLVQELAKKVAKPNILDLKAGKGSTKTHNKLHKDLVYTLSELHSRHPSRLITVFKPVVSYMVDCTNCPHQEVRTLACQFWGNLKVPPVPQRAMGEWLPPVFNKLNKLVLALLHSMVYHEDYVQYMESQKVTDGRRPQTSSVAMQHLSDLRNYAALGFEKLCSIFTTEVTPIFKLCVTKWLHSSNWLEQEAVVLAIGAYCQAMEGPNGLKEILPDVMGQLLEFYQSEQPLLRAITCFTMVHFMNVRAKGIKDPFGRMLRASIALLTDTNCEVQDQALRSLATLLAYGERDLSAQSRKVVKALLKANTMAQGKARFAYYECIGHTVARLSPVLEERETSGLLRPLMENWESLQWAQELQAMDEEITSLCSPLCVIANYAKDNFAYNNEIIIERVSAYIPRLLKGKPANDPKGDSITIHIVSYLDLISAMYEGQGSGLNACMKRNNMADIVTDLLSQGDNFREEVTQSAVALIGHLCKHNFSEVKPQLDAVLDVLTKTIDSKSDSIRSNSLWTLSHICKSCDEKNDKLIKFALELTELMMNLKAAESVVINSALAVTNLAVKFPNSVLKVLFKEEAFTHLCALLQNQFSNDDDKVQVFSNLCTLISSNMAKVPKEAWIHFCAAAAILDVQDDKLKDSIKGILKDVRTTAGNAMWNKINTMLGQQMAYNMRKKYKLY